MSGRSKIVASAGATVDRTPPNTAIIYEGFAMSARLCLLPVPVILLALSACTVTASPAPVAVAPTSPTSPAASTAAASPQPPAAETETPAAEKTKGGAVQDAGCPSAKTLEGLVDLPKGWTFASVTCVEDVAAADPKSTTPADGVYLFRRSGGSWKYFGQGSGYDCKDLGLKEAPFCIS